MTSKIKYQVKKTKPKQQKNCKLRIKKKCVKKRREKKIPQHRNDEGNVYKKKREKKINKMKNLTQPKREYIWEILFSLHFLTNNQKKKFLIQEKRIHFFFFIIFSLGKINNYSVVNDISFAKSVLAQSTKKSRTPFEK